MTRTEQRNTQLELPYEVKLEIFEGPLDLLLHLVRKHELDIFDIPIGFITAKYLEYLDLMKALNLDVAGEFLYYAALLAHIKSKQLLPPDESDTAEGDEEEIDPAKLLQERLFEYQRFKDAAEHLDNLPQVGRSIWLRGAELDQDIDGESMVAPFAEVGLFKLVDAMAKVLARASPEVTHDVLVDRISLADRIHELLDRLNETPQMTFSSTFSDIEVGPGFRITVVVTFLAILELARQHLLRIHQPEGSEEIYLELAATNVEINEDELQIDDSYD
ncbi:MAG: segregation/condensation protein A [bacterium]